LAIIGNKRSNFKRSSTELKRLPEYLKFQAAVEEEMMDLKHLKW
jgi:hypothetical protein